MDVITVRVGCIGWEVSKVKRKRGTAPYENTIVPGSDGCTSWRIKTAALAVSNPMVIKGKTRVGLSSLKGIMIYHTMYALP
jgi:hypothetical protein